MLTKEECENSLINLCSSNSKVEDRKVFKQLIHEHFELVDKYNELEKQHMKLLSQWGKSDNPPLKLEELENGEWYWCEEYGWCLMNFYEDLDGKIHFEAITVMNDKIDLSFDFEENRFYRKQVKDDV
jgi:hypothetical protein